MSLKILCRREIYVDVVVKEHCLEEVYVYQADFLKDDTFQCKEYLFRQVEEDEENQEERKSITEQFKEQWAELIDTEACVDLFATDARLVYNYLISDIMAQDSGFVLVPPKHGKKEAFHDCVSMGRVVSMSVFDEMAHLSSNVRRRMKEKYHEQVDEVRKERDFHIFLHKMASGSPYAMELFVTDKEFRIRKNILLPKTTNEETLAFRLGEILSEYPDADIITEKVRGSLYGLLRNIHSFTGITEETAVFSLESMFYAAGKQMPSKELVENYILYIKNIEDIRFGRFISGPVYSTHSFYLPVVLSNAGGWNKQFINNTVWTQAREDIYGIQADDRLKGKFILKSGREQFVLRLQTVTLRRYLEKYAVLCIRVENQCYPGDVDKEKINRLAGALFVDNSGCGPDAVELKIKTQQQAYSLSALPFEGNETQLWLNGLLMLGNTKKKNAFVMQALSEEMYCLEEDAAGKIIPKALVRDGILRDIERQLAACLRPSNGNGLYCRPTGGQKKTLRGLFEFYRYLLVSFGTEYTTGRKEHKNTWKAVEDDLGTQELLKSLQEKFDLFFA